VGRRAEDHLEVLDMFFPADQKEYATDVEVTLAGHWWTLAMEYVAQQKMIVLGSAHTHTYRAARDEGEAIPSIGDMESWEVPDLICGIANVVEGSGGKKKCGDIASYGPPINCDVTVKRAGRRTRCWIITQC
jgi:hypothetical protein